MADLDTSTVYGDLTVEGEVLAQGKYRVYHPNNPPPGSVPVGSVIGYGGKIAPAGWLSIEPLTTHQKADYPRLYALLKRDAPSLITGDTFKLSDGRGRFMRNLDPTEKVDPDGSSREPLSVQSDAIQNITGSLDSSADTNETLLPTEAKITAQTGALRVSNDKSRTTGGGAGSHDGITRLEFDASLSVPTSTENRPHNIAVLLIIKAFDHVDDPEILAADSVVESVNDHETRIVVLEAGPYDDGVFRFQSLAQGGMFYANLGLATNGRVYIWGHGANSNLADGGRNDEIHGFREIITSENYAFTKVKDYGGQAENGWILFDNGNLWSWGQNVNGVLGVGHKSLVNWPVLAHTGVVEIFPPICTSYNTDNFMVYLKKTDGKYYGYGANNYGRIGTSSTSNLVVPTLLAALPDGGSITKLWNIGTTYGATFVKSSNNNLYACGFNNYGQLGVGNKTTTTGWRKVLGFNNSLIKDIKGSSGYYDGTSAQSHTFMIFLLTDGTVWTAGDKNWGQCGDGKVESGGEISTPYKVAISGIDEICVNGGGPASAFAIPTTRDHYYCWGHNTNAQLGLGNTTNTGTPTRVNIDYTKIITPNSYGNTTSHDGYTLLVKPNGEIWGTGQNNYGRLGDGTATQRNSWTKSLFKSTEIKEVYINAGSAGNESTTFVLLNDGTLYGWGYGGRDALIGLYRGVTHPENYVPQRLV